MSWKSAVIVALLLVVGWSWTPAAAQSAPAPIRRVASDEVLDPTAFIRTVQPLSAVEQVQMPPIDLEAVRAEDIARDAEGMPPRYAIPHEVYMTPGTNGTWEELDASTMLWRLRILSPGATSINLGFTRYFMPPGGQLIVYATDGSFIIRAFTANDNADHGQLWTPVCMSDDIMVELTIPTAKMPDLALELGFINHGYRGFESLRPNRKADEGGPRSGACNIDVICPQGDPWRLDIPAVAMISTGGSGICTGFMVNNTANDLRNFFQTAYHCGITSGTAPSLVCYWNFYNSWCRTPGSPASGGPGDGSLSQFNTGSTFRAAYSASDFTLVELNQDPNPAWDISYAGWDRTHTLPPTGCGIHHPNCDEKRITFFDSGYHPSHDSSWGCSPYPGPGDGTHIRVYWSAADGAVTEPGSSGSPLWDNNHHVIGQLHGGPSACGATGDNLSDCYGRVQVSWTGGGTSSTRLSDWLDYSGTGATFVNTVSLDTLCSDAGEVTLDRPKYACEGIINVEVVDCDLNLDPNSLDTVTITISSTSEPAGELVELVETMPNTARFQGALELSTIDSPGVLQVAEGDTITALYIDADNGQGGTDIPVTATATVDCTPPVISGVQTVSVAAHSATISFNANESVLGTVFYGLSCASATSKVTATTYGTSVTITVTGLNDSTAYFYKISAEDEAGNTATDDNGGVCYSFTTPEIPHYFTQLFTSNNDLHNISLKFTTGSPNDFYFGCAEAITSLPTDPSGGTAITTWSGTSDDGNAQITLSGGQTVKLYGQSYGTFWVGTNGYITFSSGDTSYNESYSAHFNQPRISALFDDLNVTGSAVVKWQQLGDRAVVTWLNIPEYSSTGSNTFQIEMFYDGTITINYLACSAADGLAGLSAGNGQPSDFAEMDLSAMGACGPKPPTANNVSAATPVSTPVTVTLTATDDGLPSPPAALTYIISQLPAHGSLTDPGTGPIGSVPYTLSGNHVTYAPVVDYRPSDTFKFKANDGGVPPDGGDSNEAMVTVTLGGSAFDPVAYNVTASIPASAPSDITLNATDPNGDPLTYWIESLPAAGKGLLFDPNGGQITAVPYMLLNGGKVVRYIPPFNQVLSASFTYAAKDATATSNTATVSLTVGVGIQQIVLEFPMNTDPGWSTTGLWAFGHPTGGGTHNRDPNNGYTGTNVYGYNLNGDYTRDMPVRNLTTTAMNCSNVTNVHLKFWRWLAVDSSAFAHATVEVSNNGTTWTTLWQNSGAMSESAWSQQTYDISAVADNHAAVYVRWAMGPTAVDAVPYPGWNIDDVQIWGIVHNSCAGVVPGDVDGNGLVDGRDVQRFVEVLLNPYGGGVQFQEFCAADMNGDGFMTVADLDGFVQVLLNP
ncbi:MAG TPA: Ig-like domain-containing protein [Phycisphaerae bacterium]|nr:Ig-like domain-containing protein [Phycisphaerae bacterium]